MNAAKRIQVNLKLTRSSIYPELENVPDDTMLPIYYAEQRGAVTTELANEFKDQVFTVRYGVLGALWAIVGVAGELSGCGVTGGSIILSTFHCIMLVERLFRGSSQILLGR